MRDIVLAFSGQVISDESLPYGTTLKRMLHWLVQHDFEIQESPDRQEMYVMFKKDNRTKEFIETFLEEPLGKAMSFGDLKTVIPGIRVVALEGDSN